MEADKKQYYGQLNNEYLSEGNVAYKVKDYRYDGNTAPAYEPLPAVVAPERREDRKPERQPETRTRRNYKPKAEQNLSFGSLIVLIAAMAVTLYTCYSYLKVQADTVLVNKQIKSLQSELESLQARNDVAYNDVIESVDFEEVYQIAVRDLGMVYPNNNVTYRYSTNNSGYVRQYADIPEAEKLVALKELLP